MIIISCLLKVSISWTPPHTPNGVIIAYEVSYRPRDSSQTVTRLNTTDLATSFITQSDLEVGTEFIFSVTAYTRVGPGDTSSLNVSTLSTPRMFIAVRLLRYLVIYCYSESISIMLVNTTAVNVSCDLGSPVVCIDYYTVVYSQVMPTATEESRWKNQCHIFTILCYIHYWWSHTRSCLPVPGVC